MRSNRWQREVTTRPDARLRGPRKPRRVRTLELLESRELLAGDTGAIAAPWHNSLNPRDVNHDSRVSPIDALLVINDLVSHGVHTVPSPSVAGLTAAPAAAPATSTNLSFLDVNGDNRVSPLDAITVINALAAQVQIHTFATDLAGVPISSVQVGGDFLLETDVQDVRTGAPFPGVFAAYLNVNYDSSLASIATNATVNFDPFFSVARTSDVSTPGVVNATGASGSSLTPPGNAAQKLFTVLVHASAGGIETFTPSFDPTPGHDVLLYGSDIAIDAGSILFVNGTIQINAMPKISVNNVAKAESNSGTNPFVFTVSLSNPFDQQVTVAYNTADPAAGNIATSGVDYQATSGTLTFAPNQTSQLVTVLVNGDNDIEPNEVFNLVLSNPTNSTILNGTGVGTIQNDDNPSAISIGNVTVTNVTSGTTTAVFTVSLAPAAPVGVTVFYATMDGTATAGQDYTATSGTLTFNAGITSQLVTVTILGNPNPANAETFLVKLSNPSANGTISVGQATGTILPAVPFPDLSIGNVSQSEGNVGNTNFVFSVNLSSASQQQLVVSYATANGTATTADNDYIAQSGTLTFAPGQTTNLITVPVVGDLNIEPSETFSVNLAVVSGGVGAFQSSATGTIINDDSPPSITISDTTVVGGSAGSINAVFTVSISSAVNQTVTVSFATQDNTAVAPGDYLNQSGILTFVPNGPVFQTVTVPVFGSPLPQTDETFFVNLSSVSAGAEIGDAQAVGTIIREGIAIKDATHAEGNTANPATPFVFTVSLSQPQQHQVTVAYSTADATATIANQDYAATSGTLTFAVGQTSQLVTVNVIGDTTTESNEAFFVNLSNPVGDNIFSGTAVGTIVNDDGQMALIQLKLANNSGVLLPDNATLNLGDTFLLEAFVQDIQTDPKGVYEAYLDAIYNSNLVQVNGAITYGVDFTNGRSGDATTTPGLIDEAGAFASSLTPPAQPGQPQLLFSIPLKTIDVGLATFTPEPADLPGHDVLEFENDNPIPVAAVNFIGTQLNIGSNVFSINSVTQAEGSPSGVTNFVFTVTRFLPSSDPATVIFSTTSVNGNVNATATPGQDYVAQTGTLSFAPGVTTQTITIAVNKDTTDEPDETFFVKLSGAVGATSTNSPGVGTIQDDDAAVGVSVGDASASEGQDLTFAVTLSAVSGKTVTVAYTTADSSSGNKATAGLDYLPVSGTLTFLPGETQKSVTVTALPDVVVDPNETFQVVLSSPSNSTLARPQGTGSIVDIPPAIITGQVFVDLDDDGIKSGTEVGIGNVIIVATRDGNNATQTTLTNADGTYALVGLQPGTWTVREIQPGFFTDGRDKHLGLETPTNDKYSGIVLAPSAAASGYNFGEGGVRSDFVSTFLNRRAFFASSVVTGHYGPATTTSNLNLRGGDVWVSFDGGWQGMRTVEALFDAGQGSATMTLYDDATPIHALATSVPTPGGSQLQYLGVAGHTYFLRVSGTNGNVSLRATDSMSISGVSLTEGNAGTSNAVFSVTLSAPRPQTVTVVYATVDGTATAASGDYVAQSGTLTFAPGVTTKLITVAVVGDGVAESDEAFSVVLSSPTNITLASSIAIGQIKDDDTFNFGGFFASGAVATTSDSSTSSPPAAAPAAQPAAGPAAQTATVTATTADMASAPVASTSATDAALAEDDDWVTDALLA